MKYLLFAPFCNQLSCFWKEKRMRDCKSVYLLFEMLFHVSHKLLIGFGLSLQVIRSFHFVLKILYGSSFKTREQMFYGRLNLRCRGRLLKNTIARICPAVGFAFIPSFSLWQRRQRLKCLFLKKEYLLHKVLVVRIPIRLRKLIQFLIPIDSAES